MSSLTPIYGKLSYIFPACYCLFGSSIILAIGSGVTAFSPSLAVFLVGRVVTGIGGAGVLTFAQVLIQATPEERNGLAQAFLNTGYTIGVSAGAIIAGAIEPHLGWRSLFWFQVPLAVTAGVILLVAVPSELTGHGPDRPLDNHETLMEKVKSIDYIGGILLVVSISAFLYGLASPTFDLVSITFILVSSLVLLPIFVLQEGRHPRPIISVHMLKSRPVLFSCFATLGYMMARWAVLFYTPIFATAIRGTSPAKAGSFLIPTNVGFGVGNLLSGWGHIKKEKSYYGPTLVIYALFPISLTLIAVVTTSTVSLYLYWFLLFVNGLCAGAGINYSLAHLRHLVLRTDRIIAIALFTTFRTFAGTFGATIGAGFFDRKLRAALNSHFRALNPPPGLLRELMGSPRAVQKLRGVFKEAAIQGYEDALKTLFLAGVGLALVTLILQAFTGWTKPKLSSHETANRAADPSANQGDIGNTNPSRHQHDEGVLSGDDSSSSTVSARSSIAPLYKSESVIKKWIREAYGRIGGSPSPNRGGDGRRRGKTPKHTRSGETAPLLGGPSGKQRGRGKRETSSLLRESSGMQGHEEREAV
jgi:predicted MFS family arabinose efflux permease